MSAQSDPRGFLRDHGNRLILDEVQRVPELFSYLQELVDSHQEAGQYILTGSSQFLPLESITQSLAGRIVTFKLFPLTFLELNDYSEEPYETLYRNRHSRREKVSSDGLYSMMWRGFYPRIIDKGLDSYKWYENYLLTYVERDVRNLLRIHNLHLFVKFLQLTASQTGQLVNFSNLASSVGVSVPTIKEWISILETSGLLFILPPYFENFSKRVVKTPKIYFVDTGLLCHLLSIRNVDQLKVHPLLALFENFMIAECFKRFSNLGERPPLYFWRDQTGHEVDLLIHEGTRSFPIEFKLAQSYHSDFKKGVERWLSLTNNPSDQGLVIYCGDSAHEVQSKIPCLPWYQI